MFLKNVLLFFLFILFFLLYLVACPPFFPTTSLWVFACSWLNMSFICIAVLTYKKAKNMKFEIWFTDDQYVHMRLQTWWVSLQMLISYSFKSQSCLWRWSWDIQYDVQISLEKNLRSDQVKYCHVPWECLSFQDESYKFLKWLMYDLSAIKSVQPNPWLKNCKFPQISSQA